MSIWTHIRGQLIVSPMGRTQPEKTYILHTVLQHLPFVTGSEGNMRVIPMRVPGANSWSTHNEFGEPCFGKERDSFTTIQEDYILVLHADLRDRTFSETYREFIKWMCRLAKRVEVTDIVVKLWERYSDKSITIDDATPFSNMDMWPSWADSRNNGGEPCWAEYLMWEKSPNSDLPIGLDYKYYNDKVIDDEMKRRKKWREDVIRGNRKID